MRSAEKAVQHKEKDEVKEMTILGLHHITLVSENAQRTVDFYTRVLGQRFVKKTVNFDAPDSYHLYFADEVGHPGSVITFFEWPQAPKGRPGVGGTHHLALTVSSPDGLLQWKRRLLDLGIAVKGPFDDAGYTAIRFNDPDGVILEIVTDSANKLTESDSWPEAVPDITPTMALNHGIHHLTAITADLERTNHFLSDLLGWQRVSVGVDPDNAANALWSWSADGGKTLIRYIEQKTDRVRARVGIGQTHHYAFAVADEPTQLQWLQKLAKAAQSVTTVQDRVYFKSIYFRDPDGHIVEIATVTPGFAVDEPVNELGQHLMLPPWLEESRTEIEHILKPIGAEVSNG